MGVENGVVRGGGGRVGRRGESSGLPQGAGVRQQLPGSGVGASEFGPGRGARRGPPLARPPPHLGSLGRAQNVKQLYALVCETQRYSTVLDAVIASAGLLRAEKKLRPHLAKVTGGVGRGGRGEPLLTWSQLRHRARCDSVKSLL